MPKSPPPPIPSSANNATLKGFLADPRVIPFLNYLLLFLMVMTFGLTGIIVLLIATFREDKAADWLKSHYEFQKRTFWYSVAPIIICGALGTFLQRNGLSQPTVTFALVAVPLLYVTGRCITGFNHLLYSRAYPNPKGWLV